MYRSRADLAIRVAGRAWAMPESDSLNRDSRMTVAIEEIQPILREILDARPAGVTEYELLRELAGRKVALFEECHASSPLGLFQRHFLLFHCLYRLRDTLRASGAGDMDIHCLGICIVPGCAIRSDHPVPVDTLAGYYLDLNNLGATGEEDVLQMLDDFWKRYAGEERRDEALAVMELSAPAGYPEIERQYRRLAMRHHPDRGGEPAEFQRLERAMGILRGLYR